jgi:hypothetical protein
MCSDKSRSKPVFTTSKLPSFRRKPESSSFSPARRAQIILNQNQNLTPRRPAFSLPVFTGEAMLKEKSVEALLVSSDRKPETMRKNHAGFIPLRRKRGREFQKGEAYRRHERDRKVVEKEMKTAWF